MNRILLIDNYDSFTYNLVHLMKSVSSFEIDVIRNDKISLQEVNAYGKILISPGPGIPSEAGIIKDVIKHYASIKSILGICLGHQAIAEVFGGKLSNLEKVFHGVATPINLSDERDEIFKGIPDSFSVGRYHSWQADRETFSAELKITAEDKDGIIMALAHKQYDVKGLQFHPESILTEFGKEMMFNWIND
ncbi:MAG: aminodeoxychorismate/anthranilate synthase component II [Bacteroidota bacterium]|nr:aminodeoxychorismate/anthranilate synthase component II [Bacteroidota bacterium]